MPLEPGLSELVVVLLATLLGGVLGWWPLAAWAWRNLNAAPGPVPATREARESGPAAGARLNPAADPGEATSAEARRVFEPMPALPRSGSDSGDVVEAVVEVASESAGEPEAASTTGSTAGSLPGRGFASAAQGPHPASANEPAVTRSPFTRVWPVRPASAAITGVSWGLVVWRMGLDPALPAILAFVAAGAVLAIVDVVEQRLPNRVLGPGSVVVAVLMGVAAAVTGGWSALLWAALGGVAMFGAFLMIALASPAAIGMGDVKLAGLIGLLLGWFGLDAWLIGVVAGFVVGGFVAVAALAMRRVALRGALPFGPSMLVGALIAVFVVA